MNFPTSPHSSSAIGIDIGGTKIAIAAVTERGEIQRQIVVPTPHDAEESVMRKLLSENVGRLLGEYPEVSAIGAGVAGLVEWPHGVVRSGPNSGYRDLPLLDILRKEFPLLSAVVDNDANVAAWAESRLGHGTTFDNMLFLTVGTGIGGGLILDGQLYRGRTGKATEVGHIILSPENGPLCGCGNRGCLEAMASGTALAKLGQLAVKEHPDSELATLAQRDPHNVDGHVVLRAARAGDPVAVALFERIGYWLGVGLASLCSVFELDAIVIGGGMVQAGELLLTPAREWLGKFSFFPEQRPAPPVIPGTFGADAGVVGAAHLALCLRDRSAEPIAVPSPA